MRPDPFIFFFIPVTKGVVCLIGNLLVKYINIYESDDVDDDADGDDDADSVNWKTENSIDKQ